MKAVINYTRTVPKRVFFFVVVCYVGLIEVLTASSKDIQQTDIRIWKD